MVSLEEKADNAPPSLGVETFQPDRFLNDPQYSPSHGRADQSWTGELRRNPLFLEARRRREMEDRPLHACEAAG